MAVRLTALGNIRCGHGRNRDSRPPETAEPTPASSGVSRGPTPQVLVYAGVSGETPDLDNRPTHRSPRDAQEPHALHRLTRRGNPDWNIGVELRPGKREAAPSRSPDRGRCRRVGRGRSPARPG